MKTLFNANVTTNAKTLNETAKAAKKEVKEARRNIMYYVNILNKLYVKNEFVDGVNLKELGKEIRTKALNLGYEVSQNKPFNIYVFYRGVDGLCGYDWTHRVKGGGMFQINEYVKDFKPVRLSEAGLIQAYKDILTADAKAADAKARETEKATKKAEKSEKAKARKSLKEEQTKARKAFQEGKMCAAEFAEIMAKCA